MSWPLALWCLVLLAGCSRSDDAAAVSIEQVAPGAAGAFGNETECQRLAPGSDACSMAWICPEGGQRTFACFQEETASGCICMVDKQLLDAFTPDVSACGDESALAALARETCGWDVP